MSRNAIILGSVVTVNESGASGIFSLNDISTQNSISGGFPSFKYFNSDLLIVAGGGGGSAGGGGGAGGLLYYGSENPKTPNGDTLRLLRNETYTVTVGDGGLAKIAGCF